MDIIKALQGIITEAETMKNAYFFTPPASANMRRAYEKKHSHQIITWNDSGHQYSACFTVTCSCHNVYAAGTYTRDGQRTTLTAIRNSYRRLLTTA